MTLLMIAALVGGGAGNAQSAPIALPALGESAPHIRPELIAESTDPAPGGIVTLTIRMTPEKGWHGYWLNPGDAGLPMVARWTVPAGVSVGDLRYPVPQRLLVAGLMNHVFEGPYALLADLHVPRAAKVGDALPVKLEAHWLACTDKVCVPERASLSLSLTVGAGHIAPEDRSRFDTLRAALPRPLGSDATFARQGDRVRIAIPYPASAPVDQPWFYAATKDVIAYSQQQQARRVGDMLVIETRVAPNAVLPGKVEGVLAVAPGIALSLSAAPGPVPSGGTPVGTRAATWGWQGFALALGGALIGGLLLNIMPCVFPILSLKAISLAKAGGDECAARREALAYALGTLLSCMALGALMLVLRAGGQSVGWAFQLQDSRVIALLLVLAVATTVNLAGVFALPTLGGGLQGQGIRGAFLTGALAAFVATPCTGPFMAAAMGAALLMPWALALVIFAGLGLGLAAPFLLLAFVPPLRRRLPKPGIWMETLRRVMTVPMALTALALGWLLWRQGGLPGVGLAIVLIFATLIVCLLIGIRQALGQVVRTGALTSALALAAIAFAAPMLLPRGHVAVADGTTAFSEKTLATLRKSRLPVFLYFTADWCVTCKVNEANAIDDGGVKAAFAKAKVTVIVGDWTRGDPDITRFLESQGRSGVPLYLYYRPGAGDPIVLPQVLTPGTLTALTGT